ncbi:acyltransferase family protein [Sphingomonas sp. MMS24-J13]|uniref:acyltransferase family protein n=1 Tax=Sphingomonas sp. MMS24-J13 TaxID=3238686 RepID=UPI003850D8CF
MISSEGSEAHPSQPVSGDPTAAVGHRGKRLPMLDGWRAISILLVLAAHMLPLGPSRWRLNEAAGILGMAVFFTLSGFLIVSMLLRDSDIKAFLIKRLARILPLAWLVLALALPIRGLPWPYWPANFLFYANLPPFWLDNWTSHYWSLCVEMQFYLAIAIAVGVLGRRSLVLVPIAAVIVTVVRILADTPVSIVTWLRVDEILAGGILALVIHAAPNGGAARMLRWLPFWPVALLFLLSSHHALPALNYARPYLAASMVGITVMRRVRGASSLLESQPMAYLATVSYAVYIIHPFAMIGWLGSGHGVEKYLKRPISFAIIFALAHLSTFHYEKRFQDWAHRVTRKRTTTQAVAQA